MSAGLRAETRGHRNMTMTPNRGGSDFISVLESLIPDSSATELVQRFERDGYCMIPNVLEDGAVARYRRALEPWVEEGKTGRNVFEGTRTHRVYAMLAKDPVFAELVTHPVALAWAEHYLGASCLLSACLAICLGPGESAQPWHTDDGHTTPATGHQLAGPPQEDGRDEGPHDPWDALQDPDEALGLRGRERVVAQAAPSVGQARRRPAKKQKPVAAPVPTTVVAKLQ